MEHGAAPARDRHTAQFVRQRVVVHLQRQQYEHVARRPRRAQLDSPSVPGVVTAVLRLPRDDVRRKLRRRFVRRPDQRRAAAAAAGARPQQAAAGHLQGGGAEAQAEAAHTQEPRLRAELPDQAHEPAHRAGEEQPRAVGRDTEVKGGIVARHGRAGPVPAKVYRAGRHQGLDFGHRHRLLQLARGLPVTNEEVVRVYTVDIQVSL